MEQKSIREQEQSRYGFDYWEGWVRGKIRYWVQELLEDEVSEHLGRSRYERRGEINGPSGCRNGYGKERRGTLSCGTIRVRRPRVCGGNPVTCQFEAYPSLTSGTGL